MPTNQAPATPTENPEGCKKTAKGIGTILGSLALLFLFIFAARVFLYYRQIKKEGLAALPQFSQRATFGKIANTKPVDTAKIETADDPALGSEQPLITVVEFADFECPYSREVFPAMREMAAKYGSKVRFIYRDYPLEDVHTRARRTAIAANCAGAQNKYWQMHDKIYQSADALTDADLSRYAQEIGLDAAAWSACLLSPASNNEIDQDLADGAALGITGTPTFFFNGKKIEGAIPRKVFDQLLSATLTQK